MVKIRCAALAVALIMVTLCLDSCVLNEGELALLWGNYASSRGEYQDATIHYLKAMDADRAHRAWALYDLGNVYYNLGEFEAALSRWNEAANSSPDRDLAFAIQFNRGIASYHQGHFEEAYGLFREALLIKPANACAKINLELAQRKFQGNETAPAAAAKPGAAPSAAPASGTAGSSGLNTGAAPDRSRLLEYVQARENGHWMAGAAQTGGARGDNW